MFLSFFSTFFLSYIAVGYEVNVIPEDAIVPISRGENDLISLQRALPSSRAEFVGFTADSSFAPNRTFPRNLCFHHFH